MYVGIYISCKPYFQSVKANVPRLSAILWRHIEDVKVKLHVFFASVRLLMMISLNRTPFCYQAKFVQLGQKRRRVERLEFWVWRWSRGLLASNSGCQTLLVILPTELPRHIYVIQNGFSIRIRKPRRNYVFRDSFVFDWMTDESLTLLGYRIWFAGRFYCWNFLMNSGRYQIRA
jgi:hypothetical protein